MKKPKIEDSGAAERDNGAERDLEGHLVQSPHDRAATFQLMRKHILGARGQGTGHLPDSRLGLLFTPSRM